MKKYLPFLIFIFTTNIINAQCWKDIKCGHSHVIAIKSDSSLWSWGYNYFGQLGNSDILKLDVKYPTQLNNQENWINIDCGDFYSAGIKSDHTFWTWGSNNHSALGNATFGDANIPTKINSDTNWIDLSAGANHCIAKKDDNTIWGWGHNAYSQLGNGGTLNSNIPIKIGISNNWTKISAGCNHSNTQDNNQQYFGFGGNSTYQLLKNINCISCDTPTSMPLDSTWEELFPSAYFTIGLKVNGTLFGWGFNLYGQLGNGSNINSPLPTQIGTNSLWESVSVGTNHCVAIQKDGTLWAWGQNNKGQLGNGSFVNSTVPIQIGIDTNWKKSISGASFSMAFKSDGSLWSWGDNSHGQLGDGSNINKNFPIEVSCFGLTTTIKEESKMLSEIKIFPNPTNSEIEIQSLINIKSIKLFDIKGNIILKSNSTKINIEYLKTGEYILEIILINGEHKTFKILKE